MVDKSEYEKIIFEHRPWIKRLITPYINVRTPISVACEKGHITEIKDVRRLLKSIEEADGSFRECIYCKQEKEVENYISADPHCLHCNKKLTREQFLEQQKFCSQSCAATYNNLARSTNDSFLRFKQMSDKEILEVINSTISFYEFCKKLNFINISKNVRSQFFERIYSICPNAWKNIDKSNSLTEKGLNNLNIGAVGEYTLVLEALKKGINISKPVVDNYPYDFILEKNGKMYRFQVKSSEMIEGNVAYQFTISRNRKNMPTAYGQNEFDFFYLYNVIDDASFIIPLKNVLGKTSLFIRKFDKEHYQNRKTTAVYASEVKADIMLDKIFNEEQ